MVKRWRPRCSSSGCATHRMTSRKSPHTNSAPLGTPQAPRPSPDLHMLRLAKGDESFGSLANACWGTLFVLGHHLVVKKRGCATGQGWYFPLYHFQDSSILAWPAVVHDFVQDKKRGVSFTPAPASFVSDVQDLFLACADPDQWEAYSFVWRSPLWQWQNFHRTPRH